jgi:hypothetical protein
MNSSESIVAFKTCIKFFQLVGDVYLSPIIGFLGLITNTACFLVFLKLLKVTNNVQQSTSNSHMYKYLCLKSLCDILIFLVLFMYPLYFCDKCPLNGYYIMQIWYVGVYWYFTMIMELMSGFFEIVATLDCAVSIRNYPRCLLNRSTFYATSFLILAFSLTFYWYIFFYFNIVNQDEMNRSFWKVTVTDFYKSSSGSFFRFFNMILRDIIFFILLLIINLWILLSLKKVRERKSTMQLTRLTTSDVILKQVSKTRSRAQAAERRKVKMITLLSISYFVGHSPIVIFYLPLHDDSDFWKCYYEFGLIIFHLTYVLPFFLYYNFNNQFKTVFKSKILFFKNVEYQR